MWTCQGTCRMNSVLRRHVLLTTITPGWKTPTVTNVPRISLVIRLPALTLHQSRHLNRGHVMNNPFQTSHLNRWTFRWNRRHSARNPNPHIHLHHTTLSLSLSHRSLHEYPHPRRLPRSRCHSKTSSCGKRSSAKRKWRPRVCYLRLVPPHIWRCHPVQGQ